MLTSRVSFPAWWIQLKTQSNLRGIWEFIDPDREDAINLLRPKTDNPPTIDGLIKQRNKEIVKDFQEDYRAWQDREEAYRKHAEARKTNLNLPSLNEPGPEPRQNRLATFADIEPEYRARNAEYATAAAQFRDYSRLANQILTWINKTVDPEILSTAMTAVQNQGIVSL